MRTYTKRTDRGLTQSPQRAIYLTDKGWAATEESRRLDSLDVHWHALTRADVVVSDDREMVARNLHRAIPELPAPQTYTHA